MSVSIGQNSAWKGRTTLGGFVRKLVWTLVMLVIGFGAGVYVTDQHPLPWYESPREPETTQTAQSDVSYSDVQLQRNEIGWFDGTLKAANHTDRETEVLVQVHVFDGEQSIGELTGKVTLKAGATSRVDLVSADRYAEHTDVSVELLPIG